MAAACVHAERLPVRKYTVADGLPANRIQKIKRDSRGFLWFATSEGLSRFDGYQFTNYTISDGLPNSHATDFLETRGGAYWVATANGLSRFYPTAPERAKFVAYRPHGMETAFYVRALLEDRNGAIWCGSERGLYRLNQNSELEAVDIGRGSSVRALLEDRRGAVWIGTEAGLCKRLPDGKTEWHTVNRGLPGNWVRALVEDRSGQLWVGTGNGLLRFGVFPGLYTTGGGLAHSEVESLLESSDGRLWVGTLMGLSVEANPQRRSYRPYTPTQGLTDSEISGLAEDLHGNLWIGTQGNGALQVVQDGFVSYTSQDGLASNRINSIIEDQAGDLYAITASGFLGISQYNGRGFSPVRPASWIKDKDWGWGTSQITLRDHNGEWWVHSFKGLVRFPKVNRLEDLSRTPPKAIYTTRNGLASNHILRLFEDSRGDLWIGATDPSALMRWDRASGVFHSYSHADGLPASFPDGSIGVPESFCEDRQGQVWIGFNPSGLARYSGKRLTFFSPAGGLPDGKILALHAARSGAIWIGSTRGGMARLDDPTANNPKFLRYTAEQGLSSNLVQCLTEDRWGRIYACTGRGVDRLEPGTGRFIHYGEADGLPAEPPESALCDRRGSLWFGTYGGLARLEPKEDRPVPPPSPFIRQLRIAEVRYPLSDLGETGVSGLTLSPGQNNLAIDFASLRFAYGDSLRYRYRLEGADRAWSELTDQRTVHYASLSPGTYRFLVEAVNAQGLTSPHPASIDFTIRPPIWQRWWFLASVAFVAACSSYALYRNRVAHLIALERVRTRLAADLHDEIGSGLAEIAILSEVAKPYAGAEGGALLAKMADRARSLRESMSDIVWAVDPRKDQLQDLLRRIRQTAFNLLESDGLRVALQAPPDDEIEKIGLGPDRRRQILLIFKEALTNIIRHAGAAEVKIEIRLKADTLELAIRDDGRGFDPATPGSGQGLSSLKRRAAGMGARLSVQSAPGMGTAIQLDVPLAGRR